MPDTPTPPSMRRDLVSAYVASGAKVASWAIVSAMAFRGWGEETLAILALGRSTLGVLNYTTLGLAPAMIYAIANVRPKKVEPFALPGASDVGAGTNSISYASPQPPMPKSEDFASTIYANGLVIGVVMAIVGVFLSGIYAGSFESIYRLPELPRPYVVAEFVSLLGIGVVLRLASDVPGAAMQSRGLIALDNVLITVGEISWVALTAAMINPTEMSKMLIAIGSAYVMSGAWVLILRLAFAAIGNNPFRYHHAPIRFSILWQLLSYGSIITMGQLADFLYAPVDFILINRLLDTAAAAAYAPVVQIDAGLLLLVTGLASVLLPRTAIAHADGDRTAVRMYYVRGTLASFALLTAAGVTVWAMSPVLFTLWLANDMPASRAILPLVLIHTIVGGSSAVGRSILLGMGKVKPYAIAAIVAGVANVVLSYCFVKYLGLGLNGIVLGTIVAVVGRCAIWQPWYVLRCLRSGIPVA